MTSPLGPIKCQEASIFSSGNIMLKSVFSLKRMAVMLSLAVLSACGGSGTSSTNGSTPTANALPGGIWTGGDSVSGLGITGIVDEAGDFHFIRSDGTQYVGTATTSGNSISASFGGVTQFGTAFADGSTHGTGTLMGTIAQRSSITASTQFTTDGGTGTSGSISLSFNSIYNAGSSLASISGNYTEPTSGDIISVGTGGALSWQDAASGCVGNGMISIINATYNAYQVQFSYGNCTGAAAVLNGVQFTGLATLDNTVSPEQALVAVSGQGGGLNYSLVLVLNHD
jgi:hypothetical protein